MKKPIDKGVLYMLFASLLFAIVGAFAKLLSRTLGDDLPDLIRAFGILLAEF